MCRSQMQCVAPSVLTFSFHKLTYSAHLDALLHSFSSTNTQQTITYQLLLQASRF
jgi:hypothetical protein